MAPSRFPPQISVKIFLMRVMELSCETDLFKKLVTLLNDQIKMYKIIKGNKNKIIFSNIGL